MTIYYLDNNRGNDSNAGTSPSAPWKNLSKITAFASAQPGDAFLLADDSMWRLTPSERVVPPTSWVGQQHNPVIIGKYSPSSQSIGQRPLIIEHANTVAGDWTYDAPLNGWKYTYPSVHLNSAVLVRINDTWLASTTDEPRDNAVQSVDGRYRARLDNQTLLLYAPAGVNPVDYYGKVVVSAQAAGAISLSAGRNWITVQDIAFTETGCGVLCYSNNTLAAGYVIERCLMRTGGALVSVNGDTAGTVRAWVRDNEVYDFGAIGIHVNSTGGAGIAYAEVYRNRIADGVRQWAQGGIYLQCRNSARESNCFVHDNEVSGCRWGTRDKQYDGSGIYIETGSDGVRVYSNVVHDCFVAIQDNSGRRNFVTGNLVYDCRRGIRISDASSNGLSNTHLYNNTFIVGDLNQNATEFGNTTQGADYPGIWTFSASTAINFTAKNNIIANVGGQRGRAVFGLNQTAGTYDISNNWVYGFEADALNAVDNSAYAFALTVTHAAASDPRPYLTDSYRPKIPYLVDSIPMVNPLGGAGTYVAGVRLQGGRRLDPGRVPLGAFAEGGY